MECFVIIVNGWEPLTIITKHSILDVAAALDPPLQTAAEISTNTGIDSQLGIDSHWCRLPPDLYLFKV